MSTEAPERLNGHTPTPNEPQATPGFGAAEPQRIRFGPGPIEDLHPDAASAVLTILRERYPQVFMACLAAAYGVELSGRKNAATREAR